MQYGLKKEVIDAIQNAILEVYKIKKVVLYGSRAKGNYRTGSDIDITLFGEDLTLNNSVYPLMDELDELYLPYTFDISIFKHIDNKDLVEHIERVGVVFYSNENGRAIDNGQLKIDNSSATEQSRSMPEGDAMSLPKGWEMKKLNDLSENLDSKRVPITKNKRKSGKIPYYGASGIVDYVADYLFDEDLLCVSEDGANLLARTYPIAFPISGKTWVNNHAHILRFKEMITQKFVELYLNSIKLDTFVSGMAQPKLNQTMLNKITIPTPSLEQQKRIVAILDKAFTAIDKAKANAEKNLANAKELFESCLNGVFANPGEDWEEKRLKDVCEKITDGTHQTPKYFEKGFIFLSSKNVKNGIIDWGNVKYIDEKQHLTMHKRIAPRVNDILLAKNGTTGVAALVDKDVVFDIYVSLAFLRPLQTIFPRYLLYFINSPLAKNQFNKRLKGSGVPNLHLEEIREVQISVPLLSEQKRIVQKLDALSSATERLEKIYLQKITDVEELKKSILKKAFEGRL